VKLELSFGGRNWLTLSLKSNGINRTRLSASATAFTAAQRAPLSASSGSHQDRRRNDAQAEVKTAIKALDKAVTMGVIHKNNAARRKSRLVKKLNSLQWR
jgi:small subunit ribosomal protein S20